jgi:hypothetical protein
MSTTNRIERRANVDFAHATKSGSAVTRPKSLILKCVVAAVAILTTLGAVGASPASGARTKAAGIPDLVIDAPETTVAPGQIFNVRLLLTAPTKVVIRYVLSGLPAGTSTKLSTINARERRLQIGIPSTANPGVYQARIRTTNPGPKRTDTFVVRISGPEPTIPPTIVTVPPTTLAAITPQFVLSTAVAERFVRIGNTTSFSVEITRQNQWVGPVNLIVEGLPVGTTAGFLPYNPTSESLSEFRVVSSRSTAPGDYTLRIIGTAGDQTRMIPVLLKVRGPESISLGVVINAPAQIGRKTRIGEIDVSVVNGDGEKVGLMADLIPAGLSITFGANPILGKTSIFATIAPNVSPANYNFVIVARKYEAITKVYSTLSVVPNLPATLRYQVTPEPAVAGEAVGYGLSTVFGSAVVNRGAATAVLITISPKGSFNGTIDFSVSGLPTGMIATLEATSTANVIRLILGAPDNQPQVSTTVVIRATSAGSLNSQVGVAVRVN